MGNDKKTEYANDDYESIGTLLKLRTPALLVGLLLGIGVSFVTSRFEEVLSKNIELAFFMPFVVYIADAIGTQTETIYIRGIKTGKAKFSSYLKKELAIGLTFGIIFGAFAGTVAFFWLHSNLLALSVGISTFISIAVAPIVALLVAHTLQLFHEDPATGSGPIATVIQDMTSIIIYGIVCSAIIL